MQPRIEVLPIEQGATKTCSACGVEKSLDCFTAAPKRKYGRHSICRDCKRVYDNEYRMKNAKRIAAYQADYWRRNKETIKSKFSKWYAANFDKISKQRKKYSKLHEDELREYYKEWSSQNKIYLRNYARQYSREYPEKAREQLRRRRAVKRAVGVSLTFSEWDEIRLSYGGRCVYCGKPAVSQDHIVPMIRGGTHSADNVVPACISCNSSKGAKPLLVWMYERHTHG